MCSLVEILSIERQPKAHGHTRSKFDVVRESSYAPVIYLGLIHELILAQSKQKGSYLGKGGGVETIFACHFHAYVVAAFRVPCCSSACFGLRIDLVVV